MAIASVEARLLHIICVNANLMIAASQVKLGEVACTMQLIEELIDPRQRIPILNRDAVQSPEVDAHSLTSICLLHEEHWSSEWTLGRLDESKLQQIIQLLSELCQLSSRHPKWCSRWWYSPWLQLDLVIYVALRRQTRRQLIREDTLMLLDQSLAENVTRVCSRCYGHR